MASLLRGFGRRRCLVRSLSVTRADNVIECHSISCKLPDGRVLFDDVNLSLLSRTFVGVVGPNGAGKSTFLKLLNGVGNFDGRVSVRPNTRVTYLAQEPELNDALDVRGNVASGAGAAAGLLARFEDVDFLQLLSP